METWFLIFCRMNLEHNEDDPTLQKLHENVPIQKEHQSRRALQQVSTIATRKDVVAWMIEDEVIHGQKGLMTRTVDAFPDVFRSIVRNTNLVKAKRWWDSQDQLFPEEKDVAESQLSFTRAQGGKRKRFRSKSVQGRGPKRAQWVAWLYLELLSEFERLRSTGMKFSAKLLRNLALEILINSNTNYNATYRDQRDGKLIVDKITCSWIQQFMAVHNIVLLSQRGD